MATLKEINAKAGDIVTAVIAYKEQNQVRYAARIDDPDAKLNYVVYRVLKSTKTEGLYESRKLLVSATTDPWHKVYAREYRPETFRNFVGKNDKVRKALKRKGVKIVTRKNHRGRVLELEILENQHIGQSGLAKKVLEKTWVRSR